MPKTFFVLGGYGGTGRVLCRRLLQFTDVNLVIGGTRLEKAKELAAALNRDFSGNRARGVYADASRPESLREAFQGSTLVVSATNAPNHVAVVVEAAMAAGADHLDYHFQQNVPDILGPLADKIRANGRCVITQAGFHPGLPAPLVRYAAACFDEYDRAVVAMAMGAKIEKAESAYEIVEEIQNPRAEVYKNGRWVRATYRDVVKVNLGSFGRRQCYPLEMREMKALPDMLGVREAGVYVAGFNWFVDWLVFPLGYIIGKIKKGAGVRLISNLFVWGLNNVPQRSEGVV
ncbi:MAG: saccharopine dehydrogenase NADP-binding domain-containing protein, partial [Candidatus Magasanikbacteria bacterium]|nr:saccharopine dehydrogenase NADP-binding domain-containing protein [Candidatus Magasanikbacteria bacterium]